MNKLSISLFVVLVALFGFIGRYNFCYLEQWSTFYYNTYYIRDLVMQPGGIARLLAEFLIQFFAHPWGGILITAVLLTGIARLTADALHRCTDNPLLFPLSLFPIAALVPLHFHTNYLYAGTVSMLLMLATLCIYLRIHSFWSRFAYATVSALLLFFTTGAAAAFYGILLLFIEFSRCPWRKRIFFLLPLLSVVLSAGICLYEGLAEKWQFLLSPEGYFMWRLQAGSSVYLPWSILFAVFLIGKLIQPLKSPKLRTRRIFTGSLSAVGLASCLLSFFFIPIQNEYFKELNHYARHAQWEQIIKRCGQLSKNNLLFQNYLNVALAEKGILAETLFQEPCYGIHTIFMSNVDTPYLSAQLSDIYFSMGHMALAQQRAFEANESLGNYSPRMLQRLVQTNLAYGQYGVAEKYINLLENTLFYKDWAAAHRRFLWNDEAMESDSLLASKRRCIFPDNRLSGFKGIDDDLKQVLLHNPDHKPTIQFLGSLLLLNKELQEFMNTLETFYKTEVLPAPLPRHFQEGVVAFAKGDTTLLRKYDVTESTLQRYETFKKQPRAEMHSAWYFLNSK